MRRGETADRRSVAWIVAGAVAGGLLVGPFRLEPGWAWGIAAGLFGGALGGAARWIAARSWPWPLRAACIAAVFAGGLLALWLVAGREWLLAEVRRSLP